VPVPGGLDRAGAGNDRPAPPAVRGDQAGADAVRTPGDDGDLVVLLAHDLSVWSPAGAGDPWPILPRSIRPACRYRASRRHSPARAVTRRPAAGAAPVDGRSASAFASGEVIDHHVADHRAVTAAQCRVGE